MTQTGRYGISLRPDNTLEIGHYPDAENACQHGTCTMHGYYHAETQEFKAWLCVVHLKELIDVLVNETEFKRNFKGVVS